MVRHFNFQYFSWTNQAKTSWKFKNCLNLKFTGSYEKEDSVIHLPWHVSTIAIASIHNYYIDFEQKYFANHIACMTIFDTFLPLSHMLKGNIRLLLRHVC